MDLKRKSHGGGPLDETDQKGRRCIPSYTGKDKGGPLESETTKRSTDHEEMRGER